MARSDFLAAVEARGFVHQMTDREGLDAALTGEPLAAYVGYDATAGSLHVGNLVSIMMLRWLQRTGHKPIILVGGGTTKVGDPSGKDEARQLLDDTRIAANIAGIRSCFERFVSFGDGPTDAILVDNADWLDRLVYIPFLRDIGRHFTINRMLTFDSVRTRLEREQPLTLLEFNYMILQAYDFRELSRRYGCRLQMGGSDQWGNIVNGIELARRLDGSELYGLTCGLITTASGQKMGKTHQGAVWLNAEALADWDYWQFWRNTEDADVGRFLKLFTDLPLDEIARLEALGGAEINEAKKILATEATRLARGDAAAEAAQETARQTFELGAGGADGLPTLDLARTRLAEGVAAYRLFQEAGLAASNGEARRLIRGQGGRLNDATLEREDRPITLADLNADGVVKLSAGRKRHVLVRAV